MDSQGDGSQDDDMAPRSPISIDQSSLDERTRLRLSEQQERFCGALDDCQPRPAEPMSEAAGAEVAAPDSPDLQALLDALDDPDCRTIIRLLEKPLSAAELDDKTEIPRSTLYRKLNLMTDAGLVEEDLEIRRDGGHRTRFELVFDEVRIQLDEERRLNVELGRRDVTPDERLSEMWSEVGKET